MQTLDYKILLDKILNTVWPVGCYLETSDSNFDPNIDIGGTWILELEGMVHVSGGSTGTYKVEKANLNDGVGVKDGGSTDAIVASHRHTATNGAVTDKAQFNTNDSGSCSIGSSGAHTHTIYYAQDNTTGGSGRRIGNDQAHSGTIGNVIMSSGGHTHTVPNHIHSIPSHGHGFTNPSISLEGESITNKNMQPYINVYRWHRTA